MGDSVDTRLGRIEAKIDMLLPLSERVVALEKAEARIAGVAAVVALVVTVVVKFVV